METEDANLPNNLVGQWVGGVWLPAHERHMQDIILRGKRARVIDGKHTFQYHKLEAAMSFQPKDRRRVCIDIGAHVGLWAMWLTKEFNDVQAFEPVKLHADLFERNVEGNATLHRIGLGKHEGWFNIVIPDGHSGNAHVFNGKPNIGNKYGSKTRSYKTPKVEVRALDSFNFEDVDFIKIDVEGYELPVLKGAVDTLHRCKPNIIIEQKGNEISYGDEKNAGYKFLIELGMKCLKVVGGDYVMSWK